MTTSKRHGCDCPECRALCEHEPGWFMPGEVPAAAEFCGMPEADFREKYIAYHERDGIRMPAPRRASLTRRESAVEGEAPTALPAEGKAMTESGNLPKVGGRGNTRRREPEGTRAPKTGSCIFFKGGKCEIHPVKPFECRKVFGCEANRRHKRVREQMVKMVKTFEE